MGEESDWDNDGLCPNEEQGGRVPLTDDVPVSCLNLFLGDDGLNLPEVRFSSE